MMRSTFAGFTTAQLAMAASQRSIDVTGQNIANINTEGYTRQRLDIASLNLRNGSFYNSSNSTRVGYGVDMTGISQLRDPFLDAQYRSQIAKLGTTDAQAAGLEKLQVAFDESTTSGIRDAFINLSNALQTLSKDDGYTRENDTVVRSRMQIIVNLLREKAVSLQDIRHDTQENFKATDIKDLNATLKNIAELNTSIKNSQVLGNPALELMDERNRLLDELGSYLPINVEYSQKKIGEGYSVQVLDVTFTDTEGVSHRLISDGRYGQFSTDISGKPVTLTLTDADGYTNEVTDKISDGTLKGSLDFMNKSGDFDDTDFKGLGYYEKVLDSLVKTFAEAFNDANKSVVQEKVTVGNDEYLKFTDTANNVVVYKGENGKYYQDNNGVPSTTEFTGNVSDLKPSYKTDPVSGEYVLEERPLFEEINKGEGFSALNIKVATDWINGTYGITNSNNVVDGVVGSSANENIVNMINMLSKEFSFTSKGTAGANQNMDVRFYTGTFYSCFANIESTLGIDISSASTMLDNQITVLNQTANSRDGISGVQLDEEGMNLLHYNKSYSAAARLMTTLDEMLDKLINGTGVVGR
ncbi:flagellar hook-associated protein FlgK [Schaedlerella arabinosiphila]|uniref:Flagellar hook-associated protein 1 n=1 Tax=Schaedlerella arabinosiphila TaxID=2044587 RepID=A0A3R8M1A9_9FIRM|nr:flagellar basal body rod C-terminal domain-containing protein [Schaedlerella arabinosiphila]RRK33762.1 flagellar hook-associated protein FlgK [Schaedlerella arabinosiphila]